MEDLISTHLTDPDKIAWQPCLAKRIIDFAGIIDEERVQKMDGAGDGYGETMGLTNGDLSSAAEANDLLRFSIQLREISGALYSKNCIGGHCRSSCSIKGHVYTCT